MRTAKPTEDPPTADALPDLPSEIWSAILSELPHVYASVVRYVCRDWGARVPLHSPHAIGISGSIDLAREGSVALLRWAAERGLPVRPEAAETAASADRPQVLREIYDPLSPVSRSLRCIPQPALPDPCALATIAARSGAVSVLDWCVDERGAIVSDDAYRAATRAPDPAAFFRLLERVRLRDGAALRDADARWPGHATRFHELARAKGADPDRLLRAAGRREPLEDFACSVSHLLSFLCETFDDCSALRLVRDEFEVIVRPSRACLRATCWDYHRQMEPHYAACKRRDPQALRDPSIELVARIQLRRKFERLGDPYVHTREEIERNVSAFWERVSAINHYALRFVRSEAAAS